MTDAHARALIFELQAIADALWGIDPKKLPAHHHPHPASATPQTKKTHTHKPQDPHNRSTLSSRA